MALIRGYGYGAMAMATMLHSKDEGKVVARARQAQACPSHSTGVALCGRMDWILFGEVVLV